MDERFRLAEGAVPDSVAASLAQRKRWHKGTVELFLGFVDSYVVDYNRNSDPRTSSWGPSNEPGGTASTEV